MSPELDAAARDRLPDDAFAYIDDKGERHLPIHDESHVRGAIARWNQTESGDDLVAHRAG